MDFATKLSFFCDIQVRWIKKTIEKEFAFWSCLHYRSDNVRTTIRFCTDMLYYACPNNPYPNVKRAPENAGTCIKQVPTIATGPFGVCINASTDLCIIKKIFAFGRKSWIKIVTLPPTE